MWILKFLFFALVAFWLVGLILRASLSRWLTKRTEEYNRAAKQAQRQAKGKREGDVVIERTHTETGKKVRRDVGDYVEFEEITGEKEKVGEKEEPKR